MTHAARVRRSTSRSSPACPGAGRSEAARRARGPRLLRHRQPAADAHRQGRRARPRRASSPPRYALVVDVRSGDFLDDLVGRARRAARPGRHAPACSSSTRPTTCSSAATRRAGAATRSPTPTGCSDGIARERALLERAQGRGRPRRRHVDAQRARAARPAARAVRATHGVDATLQVNIVSFGYKHGLPLDVDLVFDCRFLPEPALGRRAAPAHRARRRRCATTCSRQPDATAFLDELDRLFALLLPGYEREGKAYLSIGVGCTGGRHRSVVIAERARASGSRRSGHRTAVHHRDVDRG